MPGRQMMKGAYRALSADASWQMPLKRSKAMYACAPRHSRPRLAGGRCGPSKGDRIVSVNGTPVSTWDQVTPLIRQSAGQTMTLVVDRGGSQVTLAAPIAALGRAAYVDNDKVKVDANGTVVTETVGYLGATPTGELVKGTVLQVPGFVWNQFTTTAGVVVNVPQKMVGVVQAAFGRGSATPTDRSRSSAWAGWAGRSPRPTSAPTARRPRS